MLPLITYIIAGIVAVAFLVLVLVLANFFGVWLRAKIAGSPVPFSKLIGMRLRRVPVALIVDNRITSVQAGVPLQTDALEAHYLSGGNVTNVVLALIAAHKAGIVLDFDRACAIDLAIKGTSKTVLEAVRTSINPKVIDCPNPQQSGGRNHHRRRRPRWHQREGARPRHRALQSRPLRWRRHGGDDHRPRG